MHIGKRKSTVKQDVEIQALLDEIRATVPAHEALLGNVNTNPHKARVAAFFKERGMGFAYVTSFWIAFAHNVPFDRHLHQRRPNQQPRRKQMKMKKYQVTFSKTLYTTIEVEAESESRAIDVACEKFEPPTDESACDHGVWDYDFCDEAEGDDDEDQDE